MGTDDIGTLRWFGESWEAPVCDPRAHIETPVGMQCWGHSHMHERARDIRGNRPRSEVIEEWDQGVCIPYVGSYMYALKYGFVYYHLDCWLHEVGADRMRS